MGPAPAPPTPSSTMEVSCAQVVAGRQPSATAWINFTNAVNETGWAEVHVGRSAESGPGHTLAAYAAGFIGKGTPGTHLCVQSIVPDETHSSPALLFNRGHTPLLAPAS